MLIETLTVGAWEENCYLLINEAGQEAAVIDPGAEPERILRHLEALGVTVRLILNTHGHLDHIGANGEVMRATGAPLYIHRADERMLGDAEANLSAFTPEPWVISPPADGHLEEGAPLSLGGLRIAVLHTPGHSPGSVSLLVAAADGSRALFAGDALFADGIGRTDLPGGNSEQLLQSIRTKLLPLPDDTPVYPGHGPSTTIGAERRSNPFLQSS